MKNMEPEGNLVALYLLSRVLKCQNHILLTHYIDE